MRLTPSAVQSMEDVGKARRDNTKAINAVDFFHDGSLLATSSDDESVRVYRCADAHMHKQVFARRHGACHVRFTHHPLCLLLASRNAHDDHAVRYLSLHDNKFLRFFPGHKEPVTALEMSPKEDLFVSASRDATVRLWDLRKEVALGVLSAPGHSPPAVAFDPEGLIFATAMSDTDKPSVRLYDMRSYDKGPFTTFNLEGPPVVFHHLSFSNDGKAILLPSGAQDVLLIDAFDGGELHRLTGHVNGSGMMLEAAFSPDGQFVLSGSEDGTVHVWHAGNGQEVAVWQGHTAPTLAVRWSPTHMLAVSACSGPVLNFWIPRASDA